MGLMDFFTPEAGQQRRKWLDAQLGGMWEYVPPEMRPFVALGSEMNPVTSMERAGTAAQKVVAPNLSGWDRMAAAGDMASNMAGVVAPMVAASKGAVPAVQAAEDALMGWSASSPAAFAARDFATDEFGGVNLNGLDFYHGTPDGREVRAAGGFTDSKPVFLSDNRAVARTYADPRRAWDYQGAEPEVFTARTSPQRVVDIDARGADFRGLDAKAVMDGLLSAGISQEEVASRVSAAAARRSDGRISTNDLANIVRGLGFDAADIANVRDTYNATAKAPKSTVRMMFNPSQIKLRGVNE